MYVFICLYIIYKKPIKSYKGMKSNLNLLLMKLKVNPYICKLITCKRILKGILIQRKKYVKLYFTF